MFVNFLNVMTTMRRKPPFGIAQLGRGFRNEITPGNFVFRTREFEMMELEFFVPPADADRWFAYWCGERLAWFVGLGIPEDRLRFRQHAPEDLSHYSKATTDIEYLFPWGWGELEGIANRTDFDLKAHSAALGRPPRVLRPGDRRALYAARHRAVGRARRRAMMAFLLAAYDEDEIGGERRTVLRLHPRLAPFQAAVLPLSRKEPLDALAHQVLHRCQDTLMCDYDDTQSIGRRYRRQDEIGTPFCVTDRLRQPHRRGGDDPRAGLDGPDSGADRARRRRAAGPHRVLSPLVGCATTVCTGV